MKKSLLFIKENGIASFFLKLIKVFFYVIKINLEDFLRMNNKEISKIPKILKNDNFFYFRSKEDYEQTVLSFEKNHVEKSKIINDADEILRGKIKILNKNFIVDWNNVDWSQDLLSMKKWDEKYYKKLKIIRNDNSDVKYVWELSRLQFLFTIGQAYSITAQEKYRIFYKEIIKSWGNKNSYQNSVNWNTSMEVGIRAINLIMIRQFFEKEDEIDTLQKEFFENNNKLIFLHGKHIYENLENKDKLRGNHYLSNLSALIFIGLFLNNNESKKWLEFAIDEMNSEISIQINKDGTNYESSTAYHKLVFEIVLFTEMILKANGRNGIFNGVEILEKMSLFLYEISDVKGQIPLIGDNDSGRILVVSDYYNSLVTNSVIGLLNIYSRFADIDIKYSKISDLILKNKEHYWLNRNKVSKFEVEPNEKISFPNSGFYILRNGELEVIVRCGENSFRGKGTHSHNDQLHINVRYAGKDLIIDNGTSFYTKSKRERTKDRSTSSHNTLALYVNQKLIEQNPIDENKIFELKEITKSIVDKHTRSYFLGKHFGYYNQYNTIHSREINLENKNQIKIVDSISELRNEYSLKVHFLLSDNITVETKEKGSLILLDKNSGIKFKFIVKDSTNTISVEDTYYSPCYGVIKPTKKIIVNSNSNKIISFIEL